MTGYLRSIGQTITGFLPQKVDSCEQQIQSLESSLTDKTSGVFQSKLSETITHVQNEKQAYVDDLYLMNGSYYQDPESRLKKTWDKLVLAVDTAIGVKVERLDQLDDVATQLNLNPSEAKIKAENKIDKYKTIEKKRDDTQEQLNRILGIEKAASDLVTQLKTQQELLKKNHQQLCGNYFGDPDGRLDQAWKKYQTEMANGSTSENSWAAYQKLDTYRKQIEAKLYDIEQQLTVPVSSRSYEVLTAESINQQIETLKLQQKESDLWKTIIYSLPS